MTSRFLHMSLTYITFVSFCFYLLKRLLSYLFTGKIHLKILVTILIRTYLNDKSMIYIVTVLRLF